MSYRDPSGQQRALEYSSKNKNPHKLRLHYDVGICVLYSLLYRAEEKTIQHMKTLTTVLCLLRLLNEIPTDTVRGSREETFALKQKTT